MEFNLTGLVWRIVFVVVAILALILSRRQTMAQRATEAIGILAVFGAAWVLVVGFELQVLAPFVVAAAAAFGLLSVAESRR